MKIKNVSLILLVFFLSACLPASQLPTATATLVLPTTTATLTPTETPIPTPTEAPLPAEMQPYQDKLKGTRYEYGWSQTDKTKIVLYFTGADGKKVEVPEIAIDKDTLKYTRTYTFDNPSGETNDITVKDSLSSIKIGADGKSLEVGEAWKINSEGVWERKHAISPEGKETDIPLYSFDEAVNFILDETHQIEKIPGAMDDNSRYRVDTVSHLTKMRVNITPHSDTVELKGFKWPVNILFSAGNIMYTSTNVLYNPSLTKVTYYEYCVVNRYAFMLVEKADSTVGYMFIDDPSIQTHTFVDSVGNHPFKLDPTN